MGGWSVLRRLARPGGSTLGRRQHAESPQDSASRGRPLATSVDLRSASTSTSTCDRRADHPAYTAPRDFWLTRKTAPLTTEEALDLLDVGIDHQLGQVEGRGVRLPAQLAVGLGCVTHERVDLGRSAEALSL